MKGVLYFRKTQTKLKIAIVATEKTIAHGLMFRKRLAADHGMLFVFPDYQPRSFWMKNTYIPLDVLFIKDDVIVDIQPNAVPLSLELLPTQKKCNVVLEVNANYAQTHGIKIGDRIHLEFQT
jgi:uncharacterized membrane protein (UPF0127 family)